MNEYYDPMYGPLELTALESSLLELPELQRLRWLNHLTFTYVVFPSAKYSRYEHTLGSLGLLKRCFRYFNLSTSDQLVSRIATILHDLGQGPFCQAFRDLMKRVGGEGSPLLRTAAMLQRDKDKYIGIFEQHKPELVQAQMSSNDLFEKIVALLEGKPPELARLVFSGVGIDRIEYYMRDARYTGVASGRIDVEYLFTGLDRRSEAPYLVFQSDSLAAIEALLMRRNLLYFAVYSDPINRRVQSGMVRGLELLCKGLVETATQWQAFTDGEMWCELRRLGSPAASFAEGSFLKQVLFVRKSDEGAEPLFNRLEELVKANESLKKLEDQLRDRLEVSPGEVVVDYDKPIVPRDVADIGVRSGAAIKALADTTLVKEFDSVEKRVTICGVYCAPHLQDVTVRSLFNELVGL